MAVGSFRCVDACHKDPSPNSIGGASGMKERSDLLASGASNTGCWSRLSVWFFVGHECRFPRTLQRTIFLWNLI